MVFQVEKHIDLQIYKKIRKEDLFTELNLQLASLDLQQELENEEFIRKIVLKANKKLHYIFKYLQFRLLPVHNQAKNTIKQQQQKHKKKQIVDMEIE